MTPCSFKAYPKTVSLKQGESHLSCYDSNALALRLAFFFLKADLTYQKIHLTKRIESLCVRLARLHLTGSVLAFCKITMTQHKR